MKNTTNLLEIETMEEVEEQEYFQNIEGNLIEEEQNQAVNKINDVQDEVEEQIFCCLCSEEISAKEFFKHVDNCGEQNK